MGHSCDSPFGLQSYCLLVTNSFSGPDRMDNLLKLHTRPTASTTFRSRPLRSAPTTHPYPVEKFLVFIGLQGRLPAKILSGKDLAAESSRVRTYGTFGGNLHFLFRIAVLVSGMNAHAVVLPSSIFNFQCASRDGNYLQKESNVSGVLQIYAHEETSFRAKTGCGKSRVCAGETSLRG